MNNRCERVFRVKHSQGQVLDEFYTIIDLGGRVLNLFIEHELYDRFRWI